ncbi:fasciclin-1-like [Paramacrobiotus metropolitanus]|uniref:fasciclin-1-like n=1 Tax=Paramacrobiotus metropolitanus TaxID=2943436 RepID=UPI002445ED39|nr:fasciclin-1-like [Paramacrobiotus metropolitanus]
MERLALSWTLLVCLVDGVFGQGVYQLLAGNGLTEFEKIVNSDFLMKALLSSQTSPMTVFVPSDEAIRRWRSANAPLTLNSDILQNHIAPGEWSREKLVEIAQIPFKQDRKIRSALREAPLWLQYFSSTTPKLYINNARILSPNAQTSGNQLLLIVDDVISPVGTAASAEKFIENPAGEGHRDLLSQLNEIKREVSQQFEHSLEDTNGVHTFFLPNDAAFEALKTRGAFDVAVLRGHIVPNELLFLSTMADCLDEAQRTTGTRQTGFRTLNDESSPASFDSLIAYANNSAQPQVYSLTSRGSSAVPAGRVYARIVKANIPVGNGVVHIIDRVLLLVEQNARDMLSARDSMRNFREWLNLADAQFFNNLAEPSADLTLFIPSNESIAALPVAKVHQLRTDRAFLNRIVSMHIVPGRMWRAEEMLRENTTLTASSNVKRLTFFAREMPAGKELYVEGDGVRARIVEPDIAATNAVIHMIDAVLGLPFLNVLEKLRADNNLKRTASSVERSRELNNALQSAAKNFTVFAPSDQAWANLKAQDRDALYARPDLLGRVLKRHIVAGRRVDAAYLKSGDRLATMQDEVLVKQSRDSREMQLEWKGHVAKLTTFDLSAVNGVVHVIDQVLFDRQTDITSAAASWLNSLSLVSLMSLTAILMTFSGQTWSC